MFIFNSYAQTIACPRLLQKNTPHLWQAGEIKEQRVLLHTCNKVARLVAFVKHFLWCFVT